jgi:hypothetical protein
MHDELTGKKNIKNIIFKTAAIALKSQLVLSGQKQFKVSCLNR